MDQAAVLIRTGMDLIAKAPFISFFHRMRLWISLLFPILGRRWSRNQRGIHDGSLFQQQSTLSQQLHHLAK